MVRQEATGVVGDSLRTWWYTRLRRRVLGHVSFVRTSEGYEAKNDCFRLEITEELSFGGKTSDQELSSHDWDSDFEPDASEATT